jgi:1-deoxy-D-xylulose-5-phosphate reductoisomerase
VDAFLKDGLPFTGIVDTVAEVVAEHGTPASGTSLTVADVLEAETWARARARELAARAARTPSEARA